MNAIAIWTVENATACAALYGAAAADFESKTLELVHSTYWLEQFARSAEANRREERYCRSKLESLTK
jgi:hypothetical protein